LEADPMADGARYPPVFFSAWLWRGARVLRRV
jgi:hypothetical protein